MLLAALFCLGAINFALHKAVLESGHRLVESLPRAWRAHGGRLSLSVEFAVLLVAMLVAARAWPGAAWVYAAYTLVNAFGAWLVLGRRV